MGALRGEPEGWEGFCIGDPEGCVKEGYGNLHLSLHSSQFAFQSYNSKEINL